MNPLPSLCIFIFSIYILHSSALWFVWVFLTLFIFPEILTLFMHCHLSVFHEGLFLELYLVLLFTAYSSISSLPVSVCVGFWPWAWQSALTEKINLIIQPGLALCCLSNLCDFSSHFFSHSGFQPLSVPKSFSLFVFFFFSLFHPVCRNCSVRFWISFRGNYSMGGCRFWVSVVGAEAQSRLRRHLGSETLTQFVALHL